MNMTHRSSQAQTDKYLRYWHDRISASSVQSTRLAQQAYKDARVIALMLVEKYHVTRVVLFGSLARRRFDAESDIDLAVAGLATGELFTAMADANALSRFWIDLKPLEELEPHFYTRVLETGDVLI